MATSKENITPSVEEIKARGNQLADRLRELIEEGNARRLLVKKDDRTVMEFPLSVGVGGAAAAVMISPTLAAIGAFASLASDISIVVERIPEEGLQGTPSQPPARKERMADEPPTGGGNVITPDDAGSTV